MNDHIRCHYCDTQEGPLCAVEAQTPAFPILGDSQGCAKFQRDPEKKISVRYSLFAGMGYLQGLCCEGCFWLLSQRGVKIRHTSRKVYEK